MPHAVLQYPPGIYPAEIRDECPEAEPVLVALILEMRKQGPSPEGYAVKNLGKRKGYLWQVNLRVERRQVRVLYAPYKDEIVIFRTHKKGSPQEQQRAYEIALSRKNEYDQAKKLEDKKNHGGTCTRH